MPVMKQISSDVERITVLSKVESVHLKNRDSESISYVSDETVGQIKAVVNAMHAQIDIVTHKKYLRVKENAEMKESLIRCNRYVRHFYLGIKNRVEREELSKSLLTLYGIPQSGLLPKTYPDRKVLNTAQGLIESDKDAVKKGYAPMANPSAAELQAVVEAVQKEVDDTIGKDTDLNREENELQKLREKANELISDIKAELMFNLRRHDKPDRRRIMRSYGIEFRGE